MTTNDENLSPEHAAALRVAKIRAHAATTDNQGHVVGDRPTYHYDSNGRLIEMRDADGRPIEEEFD